MAAVTAEPNLRRDSRLLDEPISPELVLVSPELADYARQQLPPVSLYESRLRHERPPSPRRDEPVVEASRPEARPRSIWPRRLLAAAALFGGAALGAYLVGDRRAPNQATTRAGPSAPATLARRTATPPASSATRRPRHLKRLPITVPQGLVPSVLGVVATAGDGFVRLQWQRPAGVDRVAVVRIEGHRKVRRYTGARTSFVDRSVRNGRTYRYVLLSYDRAGRSSAGVITVIRPGPS